MLMQEKKKIYLLIFKKIVNASSMRKQMRLNFILMRKQSAQQMRSKKSARFARTFSSRASREARKNERA